MLSQQSFNDSNENSQMRILLATDTHVGYMEKDGIRREDSFRTFEEVFEIATERRVDFVLLGGDVFHDNRPSIGCIYRVLNILRKHCLQADYGDDFVIKLQHNSDPALHYDDIYAMVNWHNPNMNIFLPVFTIHGNHDDPSQEQYSAVDLLSVSGLVNYFGKQKNLSDIEINPILLQKGDTRLALYGLGNVRDERLHRMWRSGLIKMVQPDTDEEYFNMFVLHQNRVKRGETNYIPEEFIDPSMDLVFWGHEHDSNVEPNFNPQQGFYVTQPGSTVATSLSEGESIKKHVGLLTITGREFFIEPIPLKTVRPFMVSELVLSETGLNAQDVEGIQKLIVDRINDMIANVMEGWEQSHSDHEAHGIAIPLPLIRLKVDYTGEFASFNPARFGMMFNKRVANPRDIVVFQKKSKRIYNKRVEVEQPQIAQAHENLKTINIEDLVTEYLGAQHLTMLSEQGLTEAFFQFIEKDNKDSIKEFVDQSTAQVGRKLVNNPDVEEVDDVAHQVKEIKLEMDEMYKSQKSSVQNKMDIDNDFDLTQNQIDGEVGDNSLYARKNVPQKATRNPKTASASQRKRQTKQTTVSDTENQDEIILVDDSEDEEEVSAPKAAAKRKAPAVKASAPKRQATATTKKTAWPPRR